ncbi:MAG TPA: hypothetical protein VD866_04455 [Urbifossiella sp.]|nr:hypothetical protein [Urbifossiella sp.]
MHLEELTPTAGQPLVDYRALLAEFAADEKVTRTLAGAAIGAVHDAYGSGAVGAVIRHYGGDQILTRSLPDLVQDVFVIALEMPSLGQNRDEVLMVLREIARRLGLKGARKELTRRSVGETPLEGVASREPPAGDEAEVREAEAEARDARRKIGRTLLLLPKAMHKLFLAHTYDRAQATPGGQGNSRANQYKKLVKVRDFLQKRLPRSYLSIPWALFARRK